jgi:hypothetical protein
MDSVDQQLIGILTKEAELNSKQATEMVDPAPPVQTEATPATEMVQATETPTGNQEPVAAAETAAPTTEAPDFDKFIAEASGGIFKTTDEFKSNLPKFSSYDEVIRERDSLKEKAEKDPFVNQYAKKINELLASGASQEQIDNFHKINRVGNINDLNPLDAKLAKMVLVDGWKEDIAKLQLAQDFPLDDYEADSPERKIMEERLRISAEQDKKALNDYKTDMSTPKAVATEEVLLQQQAAQKQHDDYVKQTVPQITKELKGMGELTFKIKDGDEFKMAFDYPDDFKKNMGNLLFDYFSDGMTQINQETIGQAFRAINANYLDQNFPQVAQKIYEQAYANAWEKAVNKYENKSGLPKSAEVHTPTENLDKARYDFERRIAGMPTN